MPFKIPPPRTSDDTGGAPRDKWPPSTRVAMEMGKVLLGQLIAWALRRWWE
ncbi:hypothetical protein [Umezawaea sp. Da 62-37]|uniref:hypothetical protein n=1 Tax=Umezawaea sp. Da 62-37 TaxID=3075927 RepID=UPI0028F6C104|nr:hypothetical protein [Umezawaea sp. Da 62-37]WNV87658.1 hypothetical protein RM788_04995 [Umezawaea sp. Da 62-37]